MLKRQILNSKGQALLIIVLVMVVALTITLSVISRAVVNLRTTQEQVDSQKALAAAEAGIEQTIKSGTAIANGSFTNTKYSTTINDVSGSSFLVNGGVAVEQDKGTYIWLSPYTGDATQWNQKWNGTLYIYWGESTTPLNNAALEIAVISGADVASANIKRYAIDPAGRGNGFSDPFESAGYTVEGKTLRYRAAVTVTNGMLVRVIPVYKDSFMAVTSATPLPLQGKIISATGCVPDCTSSSQATRKVTVFQGFPELPADFFPYSLLIPSH
ncbi:MAG: hypothetical protein A2959_00805 [Candidatus Levybacteria bacterium RIFCSPLOWO2_01_FULL_38_23]|nr:MAG: hypothetical protein A2959_00805 [Candidatus Levybacteria bacterium RIFCSPLOWO2_01_FULL_38_23]